MIKGPRLGLILAMALGLGAAAPAPKTDPALKALFDQIDQGLVDDRGIAALRAAAEGGSGPAAQRLGYLYLYGIGLEANYPLAYRWYCAAALANVPFSIDTATRIFNRMTPSARVKAEGLIATLFSASEIARLDAMRPAGMALETANPGADNGSLTK